MIVLHHLERSRSERVAWLLEELGLPYEVVRHKRDPKTMLAPRELFAVHPLGKAPVLVEDGTAMIESGAIVTALIERHGATSGLKPAPGTPDHLAWLTFMHFAEGSLMPPLLLRLIFGGMSAKAPALLRPAVKALTEPVERLYVRPNIGRLLDFCEAELGKRPWFAGEAFTAADIMMSFPLRMATQRGGLDGSRPKLMDWLRRIAERPARKAAIARIGEG